jgi:hypothetical protein
MSLSPLDPPVYCQRQIEGESECAHSCDHCWVYYYPLIVDHTVKLAYEDWVQNNPQERYEGQWDYALRLFQAGFEFHKEFLKTFNHGHSDDSIF